MSTTFSVLIRKVPGVFIIFMMSFFLHGCTDTNNNGVQPPAPVDKQLDVAYGTDVRHKLDIYLPQNRNSNTPFILLIHGGAWVSGDKSDMRQLQDSLLKKGIASASMNYRFVHASLHFEDLMADVGLALHYCYSKRNEWNIRQDKYMIGGASAGAHMALLYAYAYDTENRIGGIISAAGPADIANTEYLNYSAIIGLLDEIQYMTGAEYIAFQPLHARFKAASPLNNIKNVPTLMAHGTADLVVPIAHAQNLKAALDGQGISNRLVTFENAGHDLGLANPSSLQLLITEIETWCKTYGR